MTSTIIKFICSYVMFGCLVFMYASTRINKEISDLEKLMFYILGHIFYPIIYLIEITGTIIGEIQFRKKIN